MIFQLIINTYLTTVPRVLAGILSNSLTTTAKFENLASSNWTCTIFEKLCRLSFVSIRPKLHLLVHNGVRFFPPVYLHLIFEISSVTWFFFNFEISSLKNQKINLISKLIFAGYTGSKNQVRTRQKIKFVSKSIFFFEFVINSQIDISKIKHR